jgi:hypothetical protein
MATAKSVELGHLKIREIEEIYANSVQAFIKKKGGNSNKIT